MQKHMNLCKLDTRDVTAMMSLLPVKSTVSPGWVQLTLSLHLPNSLVIVLDSIN